MLKEIKKVGGSVGILLPKIIMTTFGWDVGEHIDVEITSEEIIIRRFQPIKTADDLKKELENDSTN